MKNYFTKIMLTIALVLSLTAFNLQAEDDAKVKKDLKENLPYLMGTNNAGTLFYLAFHPCWETNSQGNALRIYVSSAVATTVTLEIKGLGIFRQKQTVPNDVIDFMLTPSEGQPYTKTDRVPPLPEQIWEGRAIKISADDPIIVYGVTRFYATSDGYLALPASSLSNNYQVSSYADPTNNTFQWLNSFTSIIGIYENTRVTFRMGGCESCFALKEDGTYLTFNQTIRRTLNEGDVWLIPGIGPFNDLSGSTVKANKPINVISGNFCAYIPTHIAACDFIIEQEMPENMWGNKYHVTPIHTRKNYSIIKVFAKKPFTTVNSDGNPWLYIATPGGVAGTGHIESRAGVMNPGDVTPAPIEVSSDEAINVVQFNPGSQDDGIENDPFQLVLTPTQQYQNEIVFNTPGIRGQYGFKNNFINIVYKATIDGGIPEDMMWAEVVDGNFRWIPMSSYSGNPGQRFFTTEEDGRHYRSKFMKLPYDGVFRIKANDGFAAYAYGSDYYDSYGWPTSVAVADLETPDSLAPYVEFAKDCGGDVAGYVLDEPRIDPENRSNLGLVYMATDNSYNYRFDYDPFVAGTDPRTNWRLTVRNAALNAQAHLVFMDRVGNRTDTIINHFAISPNMFPYYNNYGTFKVENPNLEKSFTFTVKNDGDNPIPSSYDIFVILDSDQEEGKAGDIVTYQNFDLVDVKDVNFAPMAVGQERKFDVKFTARAEGSYRDSVGIKVIDRNTGEVCVFQYFAEVVAFVGNPYITTVDRNFYEQVVNNRTIKYDLKVTNPNTGDYIATTPLVINGIELSGDEIGLTGSDAVFEIDGLNNISPANPIVIAPGESHTFSVSFMPKEVRSYLSRITFIADADMPKNFSVLEGVGIQPGLLVNGDNWGERLVDPNSYVERGGTWDYTPYPSPNGAIVLTNDGSAPVTLRLPEIVTDETGVGFKAVRGGNLASLTAPGVLADLFQNKTIQPGDNLTVPVFFDPKVEGPHQLVLRFPSDATDAPTSTLVGVGVLPRIETIDLDFDQRIVGLGSETKTFTFTAVDWQYDYPVTITDFVAQASNAATTVSEADGNGILRWDRDNIRDKDGNVVTLPFTLNPNDYLTISVEFEPTNAGIFEATFTSVSDAQREATSIWTASAIEVGTSVTTATATTCLLSPVTLRPTITNDGSVDLRILNIAIESNNPGNINFGDFVVQNPNFLLTPGANEEILIIFTPTKDYNNTVLDVVITTDSPTTPEVRTTITVTSTHVVQPTFSRVGIGGVPNETSVQVDPGEGDAVSYSIAINTANAVPLAESMIFEARVTYSKDFLGLSYVDRNAKTAKIQIGAGLQQLGWQIASWEVLSFDQATNEETISIIFTGASPITGSHGNLVIVNILFDSYLPWYKDSD
ncbi:MAG: IgGFc-binding protein, partial [Candidatus Kapabacteria bacterium]|nr:IgGFc-binding protein [Ignavibacteriota bacterium]MCW5885507.1 IgGFc-binding protein [Candidatus Kapabacteria bacterium]